MLDNPAHTFAEGCRHYDANLQRIRLKEEGARRKAGPHRDRAVPPAGVPLREVASDLGGGQMDSDRLDNAEISKEPHAETNDVVATEDQPLSIGMPNAGPHLAPKDEIRETASAATPILIH